MVAVALCAEGIANYAAGPNQYSFTSPVSSGVLILDGAVVSYDGIVLIGVLLVAGAVTSWFLHRTVLARGCRRARTPRSPRCSASTSR